MLSKSKISFIKSLGVKKYRDANHVFVVEGEKPVNEIINSNYSIKSLFVTEAFSANNEGNALDSRNVFTINEREMKKISFLSNPSNVLAVVNKPNPDFNIFKISEDLCYVFEDLQNPGNLGNIVRTCDWFGIKNIVLSLHSADVFSPKAIQACMGSFLRVNVFYKELSSFLEEYHSKTKQVKYGAVLDGKNIYKENLDKKSLVIFGNEGKGISDDIKKHIDVPLTIPIYDKLTNDCESLNIGSSVSVFSSEFRKPDF